MPDSRGRGTRDGANEGARLAGRGEQQDGKNEERELWFLNSVDATPRLLDLERIMADIPWPWPDEHYDSFVFRAALEVIESRRPRVLYVNFGETDEWAHARRYDNYLDSAQRVDRWTRELWEKMQSIEQYRGTTTLIITTDHGRGMTPQDWTSHGEKIPNAGEWWCAALGPDTPALGARKDCAPVTQAQIAATIARALGEDFRAAVPEAAEPLADVLTPR